MADLENLLAEIDVSETFAPISAAIRTLTQVIDESHRTVAGQLQSIHNACLELLKRSKHKSPCSLFVASEPLPRLIQDFIGLTFRLGRFRQSLESEEQT
ncbi:hypothetical protein Y032_0005g2672 [Ancylostoma ceylanicum]|uniref:Uncharacterized protein n=1 Tax=Ancylostoma ceylanicum TaxID=53326 RepID=A0A016VSV8_9BILA|nr:hypothetical protein Y032_0005g2672 [Ancylostoma ceylanicum]